MKKLPAFLILLLSVGICRSQNITNTGSVEAATAGVAYENGSSDVPFFSSPADAEKIVSAIMDAVGLDADFKIKAARVPNVEAKIRHHQRYILYNQHFVDQVNKATKDKWASVFMLAHEIGHHLDGHTLVDVESRPEIELEADRFAGFALCKMGATLEEAQLVIHYIAGLEASSNHPARADRLAAIQRGWNRAATQRK